MKFFFVLFFTTLFAHDYHVSNTLIHQNTEANTLEITIKIFHDDLDHIREIQKENSKDENFIFDTEKYIQDNFEITINNEILTLTAIGREVEDELVYCYFEAVDIPNISSFEVRNTILFDLFDDQTNMIDVELPNVQERILLTHSKSKIVLK